MLAVWDITLSVELGRWFRI